MSRAMRARLAALERLHLVSSTDPIDLHAVDDAYLWRAVAKSVRIVLQSHAWPFGLADLLQRMEADTMTEEDAQLGERITEALIVPDLTAAELLRLVFNVDASV